MPKIPIYQATQDLPAVARDVSVVGHAKAAEIMAGAAVVEAGKELTRSSAAIGSHILHLLAQRKEMEEHLQKMEMATAVQRGLHELHKTYQGADSDEALNEFEIATKDYVQKLVDSAKTPYLKEYIKQKANEYYIHYESDLKSKIRKRQIDKARAATLSTLETLERLEAEAPDPIAQEKFRKDREQAIENMVRGGVITAVEGQKYNQEINERLAYRKVLEDIRQDPQGALSRLSNGAYKDLDPLKKESLIRTAQQQANMQLKRAEAELNARIKAEEMAERAEKKAYEERLKANLGRAMSLARKGQLTFEEVDRLLQTQMIDEAGHSKLTSVLVDGFENKIKQAEKIIDDAFVVTDERFKYKNDFLKRQLKIEIQERAKAGENPSEVAWELVDRNSRRPPDPRVLSVPMGIDVSLLHDRNRYAEALNQVHKAAAELAEKKQAGKISELLYKQESIKLMRLEKSLRYYIENAPKEQPGENE